MLFDSMPSSSVSGRAEALMGAAVEITRTDHTAEGLRGLAAKATDGAQVRSSGRPWPKAA